MPIGHSGINGHDIKNICNPIARALIKNYEADWTKLWFKVHISELKIQKRLDNNWISDVHLPVSNPDIYGIRNYY